VIPAARRLLLLALFLACTPSTGAPRTGTPARVVIETAGGAHHAVTVELARTPEERARGLMQRQRLDPDAGMLFLFEETARHGFWMKNTLIPLDLVFLSEDGRIAAIVEGAAPHSLTLRDGGVESRYVLEVNGGWTRARAVNVGDRVRFEGVLF
jgi:uncharacterized membrane protein (UPF0127 family)